MGPSASKSALLLSPCLRWTGPDAREYREENTDTSKRDKGTAFHDSMDEYYKTAVVGRIRDLEVQLWADAAAAWSKEHLEPRCSEIHSEVYVAFNFATGEVHSDATVFNRKYPDKLGYLPGTADLVCVLHTGELYVADWKTGGGTGADKQLMSLALGLRSLPQFMVGTVSVRPVILSVLYAGPDGVHPHEWAVTEGDLLSHQHAMAFQLADVGIRNEPVVGIHCTQLYCNHLAYCPGITNIVEELSESPQALLPPSNLTKRFSMTDQPISDEEAGYTMERITAARRQMKYYEECIRKYVMSGGRALTGDFEFSQTNSGFRWVKRK